MVGVHGLFTNMPRLHAEETPVLEQGCGEERGGVILGQLTVSC